MSNAILHHTLEVFAVGSAMVYCYDLRQHEVQRTGGMERNEVRPPVSHVVLYIPCSKNKTWYIFTQYFRGFTVVWKRQE